MKMEGGLKFSFVIHLSAGQEVINNLQRINFSHLLCCTACCCLAKECLNSNQSLLLKSWRIVRSKEHICNQLKRLLFAVALLNSPQFQFCHLKTYDKCRGQAGKGLKEGHLSAIEEALLGAGIPAGYNWSHISSPLFLFGNCFDLSKCAEAKKVEKEMRTRSPDRELVYQLLKYWSGQVYRISTYLTP